MRADFLRCGWVKFPYDPRIAAWAESAQAPALRIAENGDARAAWLRCDGTWFAGVGAFPNDASGALEADGVPPLAGAPVEFIRRELGCDPGDWDRAQISVCYPGYPRPWEGENEAAFAYRRNRDAAHVDGLVRIGGSRRRRPGEQHAFILGVPLTEVEEGASPFVVWEGSHEVMRRSFSEALASVSPEDWSSVDMTDAYHAARRACFETLRRIEIAAKPGESYLVHRLALHGVAPWRGAETRPRAIAYFRPEGAGPRPAGWWLSDP